MLKKSVLMVVFILLISPVIAGNTLKLDFEVREDYSMWMNKGDRILFEWGGFNHTIIIDEVKNVGVELDIFLFLEGQEAPSPQYPTITNRASARVDFNRDGIDDLGIELIDMEVESEKSQVMFHRLEGADPSVPINFQEDYKEGEEVVLEKEFGYVYTIIAVLVVLGIIFLYVGRRNKGDIYY